MRALIVLVLCLLPVVAWAESKPSCEISLMDLKQYAANVGHDRNQKEQQVAQLQASLERAKQRIDALTKQIDALAPADPPHETKP